MENKLVSKGKKLTEKAIKAGKLLGGHGPEYIKRRAAFLSELKKEPGRIITYEEFKEQTDLTYYEIKKQVKAGEGDYSFIILIDTDGVAEEKKKFTKKSLHYQTISPCKVLIGKSEGLKERLKETLAEYDPQKTYVFRMKTGDAFSYDAFYRVSAAAGGAGIVYTDHEEKAGDEWQHALKPDYSQDYLCAYNYIGDSFFVRADLYGSELEYFDETPYEFLLRCSKDGVSFAHAAGILFSKDSPALPEIKRTVKDKIVKDIFMSKSDDGIRLVKITAQDTGADSIILKWKDRAKISVLIPTKDHAADLAKTLESLSRQNILRSLEIILIENNSAEKETFAFYEWLLAGKEGGGPAFADAGLSQKLKGHVKLVTWEGEFNYAAINNFGAKDATGELLLLLNNDVELIGDDALEMLAMTVMRSDVAAAGAKLIYADGTMQHGGVAVGLGGVAGHDFVGFSGDEAGYLKQLVCARDVSAVTAACLMMKKSVFVSIGGFNEEYAVDFNDIDLCMRIRRAGGKIIFQPLCKAYHYESKTRGNVKKTADAQKRFEGEVRRFMRDWGSFLKKGDPFYNPYLTLARNDHSLGNPYMFEN